MSRAGTIPESSATRRDKPPASSAAESWNPAHCRQPGEPGTAWHGRAWQAAGTGHAARRRRRTARARQERHARAWNTPDRPETPALRDVSAVRPGEFSREALARG